MAAKMKLHNYTTQSLQNTPTQHSYHLAICDHFIKFLQCV